jgi:hypothetical protein
VKPAKCKIKKYTIFYKIFHFFLHAEKTFLLHGKAMLKTGLFKQQRLPFGFLLLPWASSNDKEKLKTRHN